MHAARVTADFDLAGSVVGRDKGCSPGSTALLPGGHLDTGTRRQPCYAAIGARRRELTVP
jgi:hypothetical protein